MLIVDGCVVVPLTVRMGGGGTDGFVSTEGAVGWFVAVASGTC